MNLDWKMIFGATVTVHGDPSVGIADHVFVIDNLDVDLELYAEEDRAQVVADVRTKLQELGALIDDMPVSVFLHGVDDLEES